MAIRDLKVNFLQSGADQVKLSIDSVSASADKFGKKDVKAKLGVDDSTISPKLAGIQAKLDALTKRRNELKMDANTAKAQYDLAKVGVAMDKLSKMTANPNISVKGVEAAEIKLLGLEATLDRVQGSFEKAGSESGSDFNGGLRETLMSPQVLAPLVGAGLALLPGLFAVAGAAGAVALGAAFAIKASPALQKAGSSLLSNLETTVEGAASILDKPLLGAFQLMGSQLPVIGQLLRQTFSDVAPEIQPMATMLDDIVVKSLPGFNSLMSASQGPLVQFFNNAGNIVGTKLGQFFQQLGPGVAGSLNDLQGLLNVMLGLAVQTAKVSSELAGIPGIVGQAASGLDKVKGQLADTHSALGKIPKGNENIFQVINDGVNWLTSHLPAGNKTLLQLAENTGASSDATKGNTAAMEANRQALQKIVTQSTSYEDALQGVTSKTVAQDDALTQVNQAWQRYFGILGSGQSALSTVSTDITSATQALKQYGSGSIQARVAVGQLIQDDETLITALMSQAKAAGNTAAANKAMRDAFLDAARSQLTTAGSSKTLQGALVLQAQQAGINVHSWAQLKGMLDAGKGGLDAASKSTDNLSQQQEANTGVAAKMSQAHAILTKVLAQVQLQGGLTAGQAAKLSSAIQHNTSDVDVSQKAFEVFSAQLGISKGQADKLWASLKQVAGNYAANVKVNVSGGGTVTVNGAVSISAGTLGPGVTVTNAPANATQKAQQTASNLTHLAKGGFIRQVPGGWGGGDIVPAFTSGGVLSAMVEPGELVVPRRAVPAFTGLARHLKIPGLAGGGIIGAGVTGNADPVSVSGLLGKYAEPGFASSIGRAISNSTVSSISSALVSGIKAAIAEIQEIGSGPLGVGASAGEMGNGVQLFNYLLSNVFGGARIAAAGAIASIWGESTWNPFAQGTGGRGLIGWTPPGSISDAAFNGGMATQLPAIVRFINTSGDWGVINEMKGASTILDAANLWGKGVERYGINDVHSTGLALAAQIMGASANQPTGHGNTPTGLAVSAAGTYGDGGWINEPVYGRGMHSGANYLFGERGREYVVPQDRMISGSSVGGDTYHITVAGDTDPDAAALRIIQKVRDYKRHHGGQATNIG